MPLRTFFYSGHLESVRKERRIYSLPRNAVVTVTTWVLGTHACPQFHLSEVGQEGALVH